LACSGATVSGDKGAGVVFVAKKTPAEGGVLKSGTNELRGSSSSSHALNGQRRWRFRRNPKKFSSPLLSVALGRFRHHGGSSDGALLLFHERPLGVQT